MRILVTGATGFLGYHLCRRLLAQGHRVTALHRTHSKPDRVRQLGAAALECELLDAEGLRRAVAGHDAVIHAAADIKYWSHHARLQEQVNVNGSRNVARACRLQGSGRLLHVSSTAAVGIPADPGRPADENFVFNLRGTPLSYHLSKRRGEDAVMEEIALGLDAVIVNPSSIFGPHGRGFRGGEMIGKVAQGRFATYFTGGISPVHVVDVVEGCLSALQDGVKGERYILAGENVSFREIAGRSLKAMGLRRMLVPVPPIVTGALAFLSAPVASLTNRMPRFTPAIHFCSIRFQYYRSDKARKCLRYAPRAFDGIVQDWLDAQGPRKEESRAYREAHRE